MKKTNESSLGDALREWVKAHQLQRGLRVAAVRDHWNAIVGPTIAGMTRSVSLDGQTLLIRVDAAPLRKELSLGKEKIQQRMNEALGEDFIQEVKIM